jgi:hypothetical protein
MPQLDPVQSRAIDNPDSAITTHFEFNDTPFPVVVVATIESAWPS